MRRLALLFCLAASLLRGAASQFELEAEFQDGPDVSGETVLTGNVRVTYGDILLTADRAVVNFNTGVVTASENVVLSQQNLRLLADSLTYQTTNGEFSAVNVRAGSYPWFAEGTSAAGNATSITIQDALVTYREPGPYSPTFQANPLTLVEDGTVLAQDARVGVGRSVALRFPRFEQNLESSLLSNLTFSAGYSKILGASVIAGLQLPVSPGVSLGGEVGVHTERGVLVGPAGTYADPIDPANLSGSFSSGYINDHGDKLTDILGQRVPEERGFFEWRHDQRIGQSIRLRSRVNYWSDSEVVRDFDPDRFYPVQEPDTIAEASYVGTNSFVSLFGRFRPNDFSTVQERLPEISYDLLQREIRPQLYELFHASAVRLREKSPTGGPTLESTRLDAFYELRRRFTRGDWLSFVPVAGVRFTHYSDTKGAATAGDTSRTLGELGFDAALRLNGTFDYQNERWGINGLRHLLTPTLSYRYIPRGDRDQDRIPAIDREVFNTYLPPLGFLATRNLDDLEPVEVLRVGLENTIQTRDPEFGSRDLLRINLASDFQYRRDPGEPDISDIHVDLAFTPISWLNFDLYSSFKPQNLQLHQLNTGFTLADSNVWSLRFSNHFLRSDTEQYALEGTRRLNEVFALNARLRYDARVGRMDEQAYGITQTLGGTWQIEYEATVYNGPRRESDFGFSIRISSLVF